ncbi:MAG: phosphatase [Oscillospiraceae bacterium]
MEEANLDEIIRREKAEYAREWRSKNPDKVRENNRKYWERRALKKIAESKEVNE